MKVAVLFGGVSAERPVSLQTGEAVLRSLQRQGADTVAIDTAVPLTDWIGAEMDCAFVALHGPGGEDGRVQSVLEMAGIAYTGSNSLASALSMDKWVSRKLFAAEELPVPPSIKAVRGQPAPDCSHLGDRLFVKPNNLGSSLGCSPVDANHRALQEALAAAFVYGDQALVETWLDGEEYFVAILDGKALPAVRVEPEAAFYDYSSKYQGGAAYHLPCGLSAERERQLAELALAGWKTLGCDGWGRVDVMDAGGQFYLMEVNTVPGLTEKSLVPMAAAHAGLDFDRLVGQIVALAKRRSIAQPGGDQP